MKDEVIIDPTSSAAYLPGVNAMVALQTENTRPTVANSKTEIKSTVGEYNVAPWGDSNDRPTAVYNKVKKISIIPKSLELLIKLTHGQGIRYGFVKDFDAQGKEVLEFRRDETIEAFLRDSNINSLYLPEAITDLKWFGNVFVELILNKAKSQILAAVVQEAPYCRWTTSNTMGFSENCIISADWPSPGDNFIAVPSFDIYDYQKIDKLKKRRLERVMFPMSFPSPMKIYYQEPAWWSLVDSGWLELLELIPKLKSSILKNQMNIKYLIRIPCTYWPNKYKNWKTLEQDQRNAIYKSELQNINDLLTGVEKAGSSIITQFDVNQDTGNDFGKWEIIAIKDEIKEGIYNTDSQEGTSQSLYSIGVDPSVFGLSIGKGMGAGSGSDARVAFNIMDVLSTPEREKLVAPLHLIRDFNGWPPELRFFIPGHQIATLDTGKEVQPKTQPQE